VHTAVAASSQRISPGPARVPAKESLAYFCRSRVFAAAVPSRDGAPISGRTNDTLSYSARRCSQAIARGEAFVATSFSGTNPAAQRLCSPACLCSAG